MKPSKQIIKGNSIPGSPGQDEFLSAKADRRENFLNRSRGDSSARAVQEAKLIGNLKPSDVKIIKFSE